MHQQIEIERYNNFFSVWVGVASAPIDPPLADED